MIRKYLPFICLIAAAILFYWVKTHQRGSSKYIPVTVDAPATGTSTSTSTDEPFDRSSTTIAFSKHARCRMDCRHIDESEVKEILKEGVINYNKIEEDERGKTYPLEGITHDRQHVRIVIAPHSNELIVVTVIDLDKEWPCNCK